MSLCLLSVLGVVRHLKAGGWMMFRCASMSELKDFSTEELQDMLKGTMFKRSNMFKKTYKQIRKELQRREKLGPPRVLP